jgi:RNA polymerase sigma-54 factor
MLRNQLSQKQLQKLSPQQIQLMKLLQIPTASIEQRIQEELENNPALEDLSDGETSEEFITEPVREASETSDETAAEDYDFEQIEDIPTAVDTTFEDNLSDYMADYYEDDTPAYKLEANNYSAEDEDKMQREVTVESSFYEYLKEQLGLLALRPDEMLIAEQIIGSLKEDGYLDRDIDALVDDLLFTQNVETTEAAVVAVLKKVQTIDPAGIAARNLQECLLLQLERKLQVDNASSRYSGETIRLIKMAQTILRDYFDEFTKKHYARLLQQLAIDRDELRDITDEILKLNPKPGGIYAAATKSGKQYIIPDFVVSNDLGDLQLALNARNAPDLRVNDHYRAMLQKFAQNKKDRKQREAAVFVKQKIESARWFIDAIRQRQTTMLNTMSAIMAYQREFFLSGDERKLRPMILKDIAEMTGLDISTVSRVANSKYVQTEFGTKLLKEFFSESLQTESGDEVSTLEVKKILTDIISGEEGRKPYSDEKLKSMLQKRGYNIARRTVAKYREQLNIPVARLRKEI